MMNNFKQKIKGVMAYAWECIKGSFTAGLTYATAGALLFMFILDDKKAFSEQLPLCIIVMVCALAYNALIAWGYGGMNYEMLASGNMKRMTSDLYGNSYKISSHSFVKEYRPWKGFVMGALACVITVAFVIFFGVNQEKISEIFSGELKFTGTNAFSATVLIGILLSGWALLPFTCAIKAGYIVSYYWALPIAILPILVFGGFYIAGAYAKRNKRLRAQEAADRAAAAVAAKPKKINYGGLPGTKPRKRK